MTYDPSRRLGATEILQAAAGAKAKQVIIVTGAELMATVRLIRRWETVNGTRSEVTGLLPNGGFEIVIKMLGMPKLFSVRKRVPHGWTLAEGRLAVTAALDEAKRLLGRAKMLERVRQKLKVMKPEATDGR